MQSHQAIEVVGRVDASAAPALGAQLQALSNQGVQVIEVDLSHAAYLSSSALRALLLAHRSQQRRGAQLVLFNVPGKIQRILRLCGLDRVLACSAGPLPNAPAENRQ